MNCRPLSGTHQARQAPELDERAAHPPPAQAPGQAPTPKEPGAARILASERVRFEPLRRVLLQVPEAVRYKLGEPVDNQLEPIWHPEPGRPVRRLDGSLSDQAYGLRSEFEPPIVPKNGLYAIGLYDAQGSDLKVPQVLIREINLEATR